MEENDSAIRYAAGLIRRATQPKYFRALDARDGYAKRIGDCGDVVEFMLRVDPRSGAVADIGYQTIGCMAMIASCDVAAEIADGRPLDAVLELTPERVVEALGGVPEQKFHCTELAVATLHEAARNAREAVNGER